MDDAPAGAAVGDRLSTGKLDCTLPGRLLAVDEMGAEASAVEPVMEGLGCPLAGPLPPGGSDGGLLRSWLAKASKVSRRGGTYLSPENCLRKDSVVAIMVSAARCMASVAVRRSVSTPGLWGGIDCDLLCPAIVCAAVVP